VQEITERCFPQLKRFRTGLFQYVRGGAGQKEARAARWNGYRVLSFAAFGMGGFYLANCKSRDRFFCPSQPHALFDRVSAEIFWLVLVFAYCCGKAMLKENAWEILMAAVAFDSWRFIRRLTEAGVPDDLAQAHAEATREAFLAGIDTLVTKDYLDARLAELRLESEARFGIIKSDLRLIFWMLALVTGVTLVPALQRLAGWLG
jgi:hypothetical protein